MKKQLLRTSSGLGTPFSTGKFVRAFLGLEDEASSDAFRLMPGKDTISGRFEKLGKIDLTFRAVLRHSVDAFVPDRYKEGARQEMKACWGFEQAGEGRAGEGKNAPAW